MDFATGKLRGNCCNGFWKKTRCGEAANLLRTCYGEVANLLWTCYGETGVMSWDFCLISDP